MGYHKISIPKGEFGQFSKIREEMLEILDAHAQNNPLMVLQELSDILGAIEAYIEKYNLTLADLIIMKDATARAFETGHRK